LIQDENGNRKAGVSVDVTWNLPDGTTRNQTATTTTNGLASFKVRGGAGTYTITVTNATLAGYTFDPANSRVLTMSITK
jgi:hypothetical protein